MNRLMGNRIFPDFPRDKFRKLDKIINEEVIDEIYSSMSNLTNKLYSIVHIIYRIRILVTDKNEL
jgi:hypothetical protein